MASRITRRQLGLAVAGLSASPALLAAATHDNDAVTPRDFDPIYYTLQRYSSAPLRMTFQATSRAEAELWQRQLRVKITELLGGLPATGGALNAETTEVREFPDYRRERLVFESKPGVGVQAYLLTPKATTPPFKTVICVTGHGRGADDIVAIGEDGKDRTGKPSYANDFAVQVVKQGMAAVAIEPMAFGCRRSAATKLKGQTVTDCQPSAGSALLLGESMIGWRVFDVMRTIDWIGARPELDSKRIACMGISGGGTCTQFAAALDPRIKAAMVSGYLNTFRDSIMSVPHCIDNYVPGILNWAENYDVAGLIAPRHFFSEGGDQDHIFPVHATRAAFQKVKKVYEVFGVPERAQQEIFSGGHQFHGVQGIPFIKAALA
jgi:dienelactone hydrolase